MANPRPSRQLEADTARETGPQRTLDSSWPWACLGCDANVYHDVLYCRDCGPAKPSAAERGRSGSDEPIRSWIRRQSYPRFVGTVTGIASVEVALTALWLQLMLVGPANLPLIPAI
jgi:hypothetical protein